MLLLVLLGLFLESKYKPRPDWIKDSKMLILHYNDGKNGRKYKVIFRL